MFQTKLAEKIKSHIIHPKIFFSSENRVIYDIMWKNIVEPDSPQMTTWSMRIVCWIPQATTKHSEYAILIAFPLQQRLASTPQC